MKKEIQDELNDIAPFLAKLKRDMSEDALFKTPEGYFDSLTDKIIANAKAIEAQSVIPEVAPKVEKKAVWLHKLREYISNSMTLLFQPRYALAIATIAILAIIGWKLTIAPVDSFIEDDFASSEDIHQYINDNIDDFDIELLQTHGSLAEVTTSNDDDKWRTLEDESDSLNVSDEEIKQYLKEHLEDTDLKALENEL